MIMVSIQIAQIFVFEMRDFRFPEHVLGLVVVLCGSTLNLCWRVGTPLCKEQHPSGQKYFTSVTVITQNNFVLR